MSAWNRLGWEAKVAWNRGRWRDAPPWLQPARSGWSTFEIAALVVAFLARWELGVAFLALKFWQQASNTPGSVFGFAKLKWDGLVDKARGFAIGAPVTYRPADRSVDMRNFEDWRRAEFDRLDVEMRRLRGAQAEIASLKDDLSKARDYADLDTMRRNRRA